MQWDATSFWSTIVSPTLVSIVLGLLLLKARFSAKAVLIPGILILSIAVPPQIAKIKYQLVAIPVSRRVEEQFSPFACFQDEIHWSPGMRLYVSSSIPDNLHYLSQNRDELLSAFNVYFKADSVRSNFQYSTDSAHMLSDLSTGQYDYILLTASEWEWLRADLSAAAQIQRLYLINASPCRSMIFGRRR